MTTISTDIALGVMNSIQKLYLRHELVEDFIIEIENTEIMCFRFILESCSEFFSGLFRSGMKEVTNGRATLHGISCETFKLIREAMYTGIDVVTEDNAIAIWHASNQLQIDFMIELCEKTVVKMLSLDNFEEVYRNAKLINSKHVLGQFKTFISEHFVQIRKMNTFLELSYDDVLALISDDKLVVESEDQVLESIMEWIEHPVIEKLEDEHQNDKRKCIEDIRERSQAIAKIVAEKNSFVKSKLTVVSSVNIEQSTSDMDAKRLDNDNRVVHKGVRPPPHVQSNDISPVEINEGHDQTDSTGTKMLYQTNDALQQLRRTKRKFAGEREPNLVPLLNAARTCLATSAFLESLYNHHLIKENCKAKDIIFNAVLHHTEKYRNGRWSEAALHRECSAFGNFGVVSHGNGVFEAYSTVQDVFF
ncbi:unnamed protein product [Lymnaea stagnalis]|uniref:BTB domain-containing protein n=1 Tax=Lymnaea stagnalis TaxID=6523 RepID=A0AAV2ILN2_LYMST